MKEFILLIFAFFASLFQIHPAPTATPFSSPVSSLPPTPTPRPLTFAEMNALYGPCVYLPTLMYHHVQDMGQAKSKKQVSLTVSTIIFAKQMQSLKDKDYTTVSMQDLVNFFDQGTPIIKKSILLTFDDAYDDFATNAYPILSALNFKATVFVPTGLMNNYDYLYWDIIAQIASEGRVLFANHTWSHKNVKTKTDILEREISTADLQLGERGLNSPKVFSYPYGLESNQAVSYLNKLNYQLAFTTKPGSILCKKQRLDLPRVRIGDRDLSAYGF